MPDLSDEEREELSRLADRFGGADVEPRSSVAGEFGPIDPMLAEALDGPLDAIDESAWVAEPKYDGTRLIVQHFEDTVRAYTRRGIERSDTVPSVVADVQRLPNDLIVDGELTFVTPTGQSSFQPIHTDPDEIARRDLTPVLYVFDCLYYGENVCDQPLSERKDVLDDVLLEGDHLEATPGRRSNFGSYFRELTNAGEEGLVLKRRESRYYPGVRSGQWRKVKDFTERDAVVVGYTAGEGGRADTFGALVLTDGDQCIGRVGSGFSDDDLASLMAEMEPIDATPVSEAAVGVAYTAVEPFVVSVKYQEITENGTLRAPVFLRRRPAKPIADVQPVDRD